MAMGAMDGLTGLDHGHGRKHALGAVRLARKIPQHPTPTGLMQTSGVLRDNRRFQRPRLRVGSVD